jgi:uncharacterized iron-regulated membrane protein
MIHFDQFTGKEIMTVKWQAVGSLMRARMWLMAFHQGQFGTWNWYLMIFIGSSLALMSISAFVSFLLRKNKGSWGVPKVPKDFKVGYGIVVLLVLLAVVFPLFGISLVLIFGIEWLCKKRKTA